MPKWLVRPVTLLMFRCAWLLGLNWAVILPGASDDTIGAVIMAPSRESYAAARERVMAAEKLG